MGNLFGAFHQKPYIKGEARRPEGDTRLHQRDEEDHRQQDHQCQSQVIQPCHISLIYKPFHTNKKIVSNLPTNRKNLFLYIGP